jgi:hypothetical protein
MPKQPDYWTEDDAADIERQKENRKQKNQPVGGGLNGDATYSGKPTPQTAGKDPNADWRARLDEFYKWAMRSPDEIAQDADVQRIMQIVQTRAGNSSRLRGIGGSSGMSVAASERGMQDALLGVYDQRRQMGYNAMSLGLNDVQGMERLREQARQYDAAKAWEAQQMQYARGMDDAQMWGGVAGGVVGAIGGGLVGGPMGAAAGAGIGSKIGGGLAGSNFGPSAPTYNPNPYGGGGYRPPSSGY